MSTFTAEFSRLRQFNVYRQRCWTLTTNLKTGACTDEGVTYGGWRVLCRRCLWDVWAGSRSGGFDMSYAHVCDPEQVQRWEAIRDWARGG